MADEFTRKTHMVRVTNPNDPTQYVDVKVIDSLSFNDQASQSQDTIFRFNNSSTNTFRETRIQTVTGTDGSSTVDVERVLAFTEIDQAERGQETRWRENGAQEPPFHRKTHTIRISNPNDPSVWLLVQRADEVDFLDAHENGQETIFRLSWPDDDESNPSDVDTSSDGTQINPPWRFDPFQDIVDVSWGQLMFVAGGPMAQWAQGEALLWTTSTDPFPSTGVENNAAGGNGVWVIGGKSSLPTGNGVLEISTDGAQTFTSTACPTSTPILDVCFGKAKGSGDPSGYFYILAGQTTQQIFKSKDGVSWSAISMPGDDVSSVFSLDFCNGSLFLGGTDNTGGPFGFHNAAIWRSDDGNGGWTKTSIATDSSTAFPSYNILDPGFPALINDVCYDPILGIYTAVGSLSAMDYEIGPTGYSIDSSALVLTSSDGQTWAGPLPNAFIPPPQPGSPSSTALCVAAGWEKLSGNDKPTSVVIIGGRSSPDHATLYKTMMRSENGGGYALVANPSDGTGAEVTGIAAANGAFAAAPSWPSGILVSIDGGSTWQIGAHSLPANFVATGPIFNPHHS